MKTKILCGLRNCILSLTLLFLAAACGTVAGTGRSQLNLVSDAELNMSASNQYKTMIQQGPLSKSKKDTAMIKAVGARISKAAEQFLNDNGRGGEISSYKWEFNLIDSADVNAFCMPGGKVAFYTGILPDCQDEAGVAAVMGHEVAHAISHHGNERVSQQMLAGIGAQALAIGLGSSGAAAPTADLIMSAYGLGAEVGILLPFSRTHEAEADRIGMTLMAMAGYEPQAAVDFWTRTANQNAGKKSGPAFLSTHPSDKARVKNLSKYLPEAQSKYQAPVQKSGKSKKKK